MKADINRAVFPLLLLLCLSCTFAAAVPDSGMVTENKSAGPLFTMTGSDFVLPEGLAIRIRSTIFNESSVKTPANPMVIPQKTVYSHFLTIAYSDMNYKLMRWAPRSQTVTVSSYGDFTEDDRAFIEKFIRDFNRASPTLKINPSVKTNAEAADFYINMFPEKVLHSLYENQKGDRQVVYTLYDGSILSDTIIFHVDPSGQVFVNNDLPDEERRHYMLRAFTFCLGATGDATAPDSFFYPGNAAQTNLTETDWRALRLMYSPIMERNMTLSEAMGRLNIW
jgi:hypothetical protein